MRLPTGRVEEPFFFNQVQKTIIADDSCNGHPDMISAFIPNGHGINDFLRISKKYFKHWPNFQFMINEAERCLLPILLTMLEMENMKLIRCRRVHLRLFYLWIKMNGNEINLKAAVTLIR